MTAYSVEIRSLRVGELKQVGLQTSGTGGLMEVTTRLTMTGKTGTECEGEKAGDLVVFEAPGAAAVFDREEAPTLCQNLSGRPMPWPTQPYVH